MKWWARRFVIRSAHKFSLKSIMHLPIGVVVTTIATFILLPQSVLGDRVIRFLFNNGQEMASGQTCDDSDQAKIADIFNPSRRRNLRENSSALRGYSHAERELPTYPRYCKQNCAGYKSGFCQATNCKGYRRNDRLLRYNTDERSLATCIDEITDIHQQLDNMILSDSISPGCKDVLNATRNSTCYEDVIFGEVQSFTFWQNNGSDDEAIQTNTLNGTTFCKSISLNIEAVVNSCVDMVKFSLTGPSPYSYSQTEYAAPYSVFGDFNSNFNGRTLNAGNYTLVVLPDNIATKKRTLQFQILNC